ncbi:MAG: DNA-binding protein [Bacilli bacterium]|jgi:hypothetical protein
MSDLKKISDVNSLIDAYGCLLTNKQNEILCDYFQYNLSISEISMNRKISRAAVADVLKRGENKLRFYENRLHISFNETEALKIISEIEKSNMKNMSILLKKLKKVINNGI